MATLMKIKYANQADHRPSVMRAVLSYCLNPEKTKHEQAWMVCGVNCNVDYAYQEFLTNKTVWGKTDGLCFRHYVQSFHPNENITPHEMMKIGIEFATRAWPGYSVVIATHLDRDHMHNHFIIDTVHPDTGKKLHEDRNNIARLRKINDEICSAHGLSVLTPSDKGTTQSIGTREYRSGSKSESWKFRLRSAIKQAMQRSGSREEFVAVMKKLGYGVRWEDTRKNITYTCYREPKYKNGIYRKCRDIRLAHEKYTKESMEHEFEIRTEILARGNDRHAQRRTDRRHADGEDQRRGMGTPGVDFEQHASVHAEDDPNAKESAKRKRMGEKDLREGSDHAVEQSGNTDKGHNKEHRTRDGNTGWETERATYFSSHAMGKQAKASMVDAGRVRGSSLATGLALGGIGTLAALTQDDDEKNEDPFEEIAALLKLAELGVTIAKSHRKNDSITVEPMEEEFDDPTEDPFDDPMQIL